jgi:hypothetical protein
VKNPSDQFGAIAWHDSKLRGVSVSPDATNSSHDVILDMQILVDARPGHYKRRNAKVILRRATRIEMQFDLVFKLQAAHDLSGATCEADAGNLQRYSFHLIPPNGPLVVTAETLDLRYD